MKIQLPTAAEKYTQSKTYIKFLIESAEMQIDKLEIQGKTDPRLIDSKRKNLLTIQKFLFDTENYVKSLESRSVLNTDQSKNNGHTFSDYFDNLDKRQPDQREAKRYLSIRNAKSKWSELF
jgi:hypothetical protein